jgi:hypothetical protein
MDRNMDRGQNREIGTRGKRCETRLRDEHHAESLVIGRYAMRIAWDRLQDLVGRAGLEPATLGLRVPCTASCANGPTTF